MRLLLVSEGGRDIGSVAGGREGAVRVLVRRALEAHWKRPIRDSEIVTERLMRVHAVNSARSGYARKVELAIRQAEARRCTCVAVVVDRDRTHGQDRLNALRDGLKRARDLGSGLVNATALGVAVETVEAWLLADEAALTRGLNASPPVTRLPDPEGLDGRPGTTDHPKVRFERLVAAHSKETSENVYDRVAAEVDLNLLEQRCTRGFALFVAELRDRCT